MDKHDCIEYIIDMNLKCCLQISVYIVSNSKAYFNNYLIFLKKQQVMSQIIITQHVLSYMQHYYFTWQCNILKVKMPFLTRDSFPFPPGILRILL